MWIRTETQADQAAIAEVVTVAFTGQDGGGRTENRIIQSLRDDGQLTLSLVADIDGRIAGCAIFSPVTIVDEQGANAPGRWYGLGPVAVAPRDQRHGVANALIRAGLSELVERGAAGCVVLGEPAYYGRFGFRAQPGLRFADAPAEYFQALSFRDPLPRGEARYHASFTA